MVFFVEKTQAISVSMTAGLTSLQSLTLYESDFEMTINTPSHASLSVQLFSDKPFC